MGKQKIRYVVHWMDKGRKRKSFASTKKIAEGKQGKHGGYIQKLRIPLEA